MTKVKSSLPNGRISDLSKLKAFADNNLNIIQMREFFLVVGRVIMGKGENTAYQHFLLFIGCFQKFSFLTVTKTTDCIAKELSISLYFSHVRLLVYVVFNPFSNDDF